jgi:hypothetical protein
MDLITYNLSFNQDEIVYLSWGKNGKHDLSPSACSTGVDVLCSICTSMDQKREHNTRMYWLFI